MMVNIIRTAADNKDFIELVSHLDQYLKIMDGDEHLFYNNLNKTNTLTAVVVAYKDDVPVACGAFRPHNETACEIKRMFVQPEYRGEGISKLILNELEVWAAELNFSTCVLETGKKQLEAIQLYQRSGYVIIPSYGQYLHVENSICMEKKLR